MSKLYAIAWLKVPEHRQLLPLHDMALGCRERGPEPSRRAWIFVAVKLVQRSWQDDAGNNRQSVEIRVSHVGPDLQFQSAEVKKATSTEEKQSA